MAKQINSTVGKFSNSHDRMTLTFKFPNGENLRLNCSRYRTSLSVKALPGAQTYVDADLRTILKAADTFLEGEKRGDIFARLLTTIEKTSDIAEAARVLRA